MPSPSSLRLAAALALWLLALSGQGGLGAQGLGLGRTPTPDEIRRIDISIPPSGEGLPPGSGTAGRGAEIYAAQCARCHGATGIEGPEDRLAGGVGSLATAQPIRTVGSYWPDATTLWDDVNRAMPFDRPGTLAADDVYAVVAYLLRLDGIVGDSDVLDASTLPRVTMPNRDGFDGGDRPDAAGAPARAP